MYTTLNLFQFYNVIIVVKLLLHAHSLLYYNILIVRKVFKFLVHTNKKFIVVKFIVVKFIYFLDNFIFTP